MFIVSVFNQKGGVGKTTTVCNLGHGLALKGLRVLVVDIDPQANLSTYLLGNNKEYQGIESCLLDTQSVNHVIVSTKRSNLDIIPTNIKLTKIKSILEGDKIEGHKALERSLIQVINNYDIVLIDNPADFDLLTINSIVVSTHYLVPVSPEFLPMHGVRMVLDTVDRISRNFKKQPIELLGCVPTIVDTRLAITRETLNVLQKIFRDSVFHAIRSNTRLKEAPAHSETVFEYDDIRGKEDYTILVDQIIKKGKLYGKKENTVCDGKNI